MIGTRCIKTWSAAKGAVVLSSAEAELYWMIEGVARAKGLRSSAEEMGFGEMSNVVHLGTYSSAAKSFFSRRGLGKMQHLERTDFWLQKGQGGEGGGPGETGAENPADLMIGVLTFDKVEDRFGGTSRYMEKGKGAI